MKKILMLIGIYSLFFFHGENLNQILANSSDSSQSWKGLEISTSSQSLSRCMNQAWNVSWKRFYSSKTQLFYD
ncbi:MAG: hypothetical protein ABFD02_06710, partial [Bacteroidales bacterium]